MMILNEDYFNNLELTDNDFSDTDEHIINDNSDNPEKWFQDIKSRYTYSMIFFIKKRDIPSESKTWEKEIPNTFKYIYDIFDLYGAEYTKPILQTIDDEPKQCFITNYESYDFIDFYSYKLVTLHDSLEKTTINLNIGAYFVMFFNLPETYTYKTVCKFTGSIKKYLWTWGNKKYKVDINEFYIWRLDWVNGRHSRKQCGVQMYRDVLLIRRTSSPDYKLTNLINTFFPEKFPEEIRQELRENEELLFKLYDYVAY